MTSTAVKTVHLAVYDTLADFEVGFATEHIHNGAWQRHPGSHRVVTVGASHEPVTSMGGVRIMPDVTLEELRPADSAMLMLPGADTWFTGANAAFGAKAREFLDAGVPVAAICGGTLGLAVEGLLDDRDHTSNAAVYLEASGYGGASRYRDEPVVTDGALVTARATAPVEFARAVLALLDLYEPAVLASWYKLYGQHDPAGYFELLAVDA
jgi:putative intracellular protease/amidase